MRDKAAFQRRAGRLLSLAVLVVAVGMAGALLTAPESARARKGYGGGGYGGYKPCRNACQVRSCKRGCRKAKRTCVFCKQQDKKAAANTCTQTAVQTVAACSGDRTCKKNAKSALRACRSDAKNRYRQDKAACTALNGSCGGCCAQDYSGRCRGTFAGTDGYGSYFRKVTSYGKVKTYKPNCEVGATPGPNPGPGDPNCTLVCRRTYERAAAACGASKRGGDPACLQNAQEVYQACLAGCGGGTTTTTLTGGFSTTTSTTPGPQVGCCLYYPGCDSGAPTCARNVPPTTCTLFTQAPNCGSFLTTAAPDCSDQVGQGCAVTTTTTTTLPPNACCLYYPNCDFFTLACAPDVSSEQCAAFGTAPNCLAAFGPPADCAGQAGLNCPLPIPTGCCVYAIGCDFQNPACIANATNADCVPVSAGGLCGTLRADIPADCSGSGLTGPGCPAP